jgi:hypothetical protein
MSSEGVANGYNVTVQETDTCYHITASVAINTVTTETPRYIHYNNFTSSLVFNVSEFTNPILKLNGKYSGPYFETSLKTLKRMSG